MNSPLAWKDTSDHHAHFKEEQQSKEEVNSKEEYPQAKAEIAIRGDSCSTIRPHSDGGCC